MQVKQTIGVRALALVIAAVLTTSAQAQWVPNYQYYTIQRIGLYGPAHTGSAGLQSSVASLLNAPGFVAGYAIRYTGVNTFNGQDAWAWNGTTTTQIGLAGGVYTGSAGRQVSRPSFQNAAGQVAGYSERYTGVSTSNGQDAWVWNGTTTQQIGLTGAGYTGSAGYQYSQPRFQSSAGLVAGTSQRVTGVNTYNGQDAWVWNGTTTTQIGLAGGVYTGSAGYQVSEPQFQNAAGRVAGFSARYTGVNTYNGQDAWAWNGTTTTQIGLTGAGYTGSAGYQLSLPRFQNSAGQVAGLSYRFTGVNSYNGQDAWAWSGTTTTQIGLTGAGYSGSAGYEYSQPLLQNSAGQVVGTSQRVTGVDALNGQDAWVWNGTTTTQIGLTGGAYTGSAGYQASQPSFQNAAGQVAGYSNRYTGVNTYNGQDAWYFDPLTLLTSPVIGSIRTSDNFASSSPTILTDGGFLLGNYQYFPGGLGSGELRAFIFRPDLGLTDLGSLVDGGLTLNGWSTLQNPVFSDALYTIVGYGYVNGQTSGQSVFIMVPAPASGALLGLGGLLAARRRRASVV